MLLRLRPIGNVHATPHEQVDLPINGQHLFASAAVHRPASLASLAMRLPPNQLCRHR